jgi:hypothetical protein
VRRRATETNRKKALERAQARADAMGKEEGEQYMKEYVKRSEYARARYQAKKKENQAGSKL